MFRLGSVGQKRFSNFIFNNSNLLVNFNLDIFFGATCQRKHHPSGGVFFGYEASFKRPPGYELQKAVFSIAYQGLLPLFCEKPGGHKSIKIYKIHCVLIPYGSKYGSKMWSCYGSAKQAAFTAKFGLATHSRPLWNHFFEGCVDQVFRRFFAPCFRAIRRCREIFFLCR